MKEWTIEYSDGVVEKYPGEAPGGLIPAIPNLSYYVTHFPVACNGYSRACLLENRDLIWSVTSPEGEKRSYNCEEIEIELAMEYLAG